VFIRRLRAMGIRQFVAICTEPGNPRLLRTAWWGWEDSNFQPNGYRPVAAHLNSVCDNSISVADFWQR
jgi:hypothetical protein